MEGSGLGSDWAYLTEFPNDTETDEDLVNNQAEAPIKCLTKEEPLEECLSTVKDESINGSKDELINTSKHEPIPVGADGLSNADCIQTSIKDKTETTHNSDSSSSSDIDVIDESSDSNFAAIEASYSSHSSAFSLLSGPLSFISDTSSVPKSFSENIGSHVKCRQREVILPYATGYPIKKEKSCKRIFKNPSVDNSLSALLDASSFKQLTPSLRAKNGKTEKLLRALAKKPTKHSVKRAISTTKFPNAFKRSPSRVSPYHKLKLEFGGTALDLAIVFVIGFLISLTYSYFGTGDMHAGLGNLTITELIAEDLDLFRGDVLECLGAQHLRALEEKNQGLLLKNVCIDNPDTWHEKFPRLRNSTSVKLKLLQMLDSAKKAGHTNPSNGISLSQINLLIRQLEYFKILTINNKVENEKEINAIELILEKENLQGYLLNQFEEFIDMLDIADTDLKTGLKELKSNAKTNKNSEGYLSIESQIYKVQMRNAYLKWQLQDILFQSRSRDLSDLDLPLTEKAGRNLFPFFKGDESISKIITNLRKHITELKHKNAVLDSDYNTGEDDSSQKPVFVNDKFNNKISVGAEESVIDTNLLTILQKVDILQEALLIELSEAFKWNGIFLDFIQELKKSTTKSNCNWSWKDMQAKLTDAILRTHSDSSEKFSDIKNHGIQEVIREYINDSKKPLQDLLNSISNFLKVAQKKGNELVQKTLPDLQTDFNIKGMWSIFGSLKKKWGDMKANFLKKENPLHRKSCNTDNMQKENKAENLVPSNNDEKDSIIPSKTNNKESVDDRPSSDTKDSYNSPSDNREGMDSFPPNNKEKECLCDATFDPRQKIHDEDSAFHTEETLSELPINWFLKRALHHEKIREKGRYDQYSNWYFLRGLHRWRSGVKKDHETTQEL